MKELWLEDAYLKEFDAEVVGIKEEANTLWLELSQTAFYPESGGQPCDLGKLIVNGHEVKVFEVKKEGDKIWHRVERIAIASHVQVHGIIDWPRRYKLMRMHTAAHLLSAIIHAEKGALITGNQLGLDSSRIDFNLERFDKEQLKQCVDKANEIAAQGLEVSAYWITREKAEANPALCRLAKGLPASEQIRVVKIGNLDEQADAGTHVKSTKEIGRIVLLRTENKGKNNRRLYFKLDDG